MSALKHGVNITDLFVNPFELGWISEEHTDGEWKVWQTGRRNVNYTGDARMSFGTGFRAVNAADLDPQIESARSSDTSSLGRDRGQPDADLAPCDENHLKPSEGL